MCGGTVGGGIWMLIIGTGTRMLLDNNVSVTGTVLVRVEVLLT